MSHAVFISYARKTAASAAAKLHDSLGPNRAFLDTTDIPTGARFPAAIGEAILNARVVVIFADASYFESGYCLAEMRIATCGDEHRHIVVALDGGQEVVSLLPDALQQQNLPSFLQDSLVAAVYDRLEAIEKTISERNPKLAERALQAELDGLLIPPPKQLGGIPHFGFGGIPGSIGDRFVGRSEMLLDLHRALLRSPKSFAALTGSVSGAAGFGKSRIAAEYLHRFGPLNYPGGVFWLNAESEPSLQFYGMLKALDPGAPELAELEKRGGVADALRQAFERTTAAGKRVLFVADNIPEPAADAAAHPLSDWCPAHGQVTLLATSRAMVPSVNAPFSVAELPLHAAIQVLTQGLPPEQASEPGWEEICHWVGRHSLALGILNGALQVGATTKAELMGLARNKTPLGVLDRQQQALKRSIGVALKGVSESLHISYAALPESSKRAARLIARLAPEPIPLILLRALISEDDLDDVRSVLRARNWVSAEPALGDAIYGRMHRLLADYLSVAKGDGTEWEQICKALIGVLDPDAVRDPKRWKDLNPCVPHAEHVFERVTSLNEFSDWSIPVGLGTRTGNLLRAQGLFHAKHRIDERTLELAKSRFGAEHPHTLTSMNNLAVTLRAQGDLAGARKLQEEVLEIRRRVQGAEHPSTLISMNNLATMLSAQGDLAGARKLDEEVLEVRRRVLGAEHPSTLNSMNNLAETLREQGDLAGARKLHEEELDACRRVMGAEHPDTLNSMNNLAVTLSTQGDLAGARKLHGEALEARRRLLGAEHPHTSNSAWNLLRTLERLGERDAANRLLKSDLLWLLDRDPATLGALQREIQGELRERAESAGG